MNYGGTQKVTFGKEDPRAYAAKLMAAKAQADGNPYTFGLQSGSGVQPAKADAPGNIPSPTGTPTSGSADELQSGTTDIDQDPSGVQADKRLEERLALYARAGSKGGSNAYNAPSRERMT